MRLCFVVQRYGADVAGGAEYHCRLIAERLARHAEVEVATTCAADYVTWADRFPEGPEQVNGVRVRRFKVKRPRDPVRFARWSALVFDDDHSPEDELRWLEEEGPYSPSLVRHLSRVRGRFDCFILFSYRYYTTYHGLRAVADKAILVPTAEDDGVYRLPIFPPLFRRPRAIAYNSVEERELIVGVAGNSDVSGDVVGVGLAPPARLDPDGFRRRHGIEGPFALYLGRIDKNKGCGQLLDHFLNYRRESGSHLRLVLIGRAAMTVPRDPAIVSLGFVSEQEKWDALAACELLVMPSRYESLSMVTLEAWWAERPVLANAACSVLRGQCQRANAGLYYASGSEFAQALALLEGRPGLRAALGRNGRRYVDEHYSWEVIERKYLELLRCASQPRGGAGRAAGAEV